MSNLSQIVNHLETQRKQAQAEVERLDAALAALRGLGKGKSSAGRPRRVLSVAARRRIAAAQRLRWAAWKAKKAKQAA
jgi:hypothetical protein